MTERESRGGREVERETETERDRQTHTQRSRDRDRNRNRNRDRDRETERQRGIERERVFQGQDRQTTEFYFLLCWGMHTTTCALSHV